MNKDVMKQIIIRGQESMLSRTYIPRDLHIPFDQIRSLRKALAIIGPRRAGKTYFLRQIIDEAAILPQQVVFIDFSEVQSESLSTEDFPLLLTCYYELFPDTTPWFLFDEIQELDHYESGLKLLLNQQYFVVFTGSNSKNLLEDLSSSMRGKVLPWYLLPLTVPEYLRFKQTELTKNDLYTSQGRGLFYRHLDRYLSWGGFPEVVLTEHTDLQYNLLRSYVDTMLLHDVIERHNVSNYHIIDALFKRLIASFTEEFNVNKYYRDFKSRGLKVSVDTLHLYLRYLQDALFIFLPENTVKGRTSPKKVYLVDNGLYNYLRGLPMDRGKLFENRVFLDLDPLTKTITFAKDAKGEADFVLSETHTIYQVCYEITTANIQRKADGLQAFKHMLKVPHGELITCTPLQDALSRSSRLEGVPVVSYLERYIDYLEH